MHPPFGARTTELKVKKRRVFFSFHYQEDIDRVNQVRDSWKYGDIFNREEMGFFDGSIWEKSRRENEESLKNLIREGIKNTTVTCILAGFQTYTRPWVRYEIARSVIKNNGLLVVRIDQLLDENGLFSLPGPNPLDYMGIYKDNHEKFYLAEKLDDGRWVQYEKHTWSISPPSFWDLPTAPYWAVPLSKYAKEFCYIADNGPLNFSSWVNDAAATAGV